MAGVAQRKPDWTVAFDDLLRQMLQHCTLCGRQGAGRLGIWQTGTVSVAYLLCHGCRGHEGEARLRDLFAARYGG